MLPTTECDQDEQYDNHIESQLDNGKATKVRETPIQVQELQTHYETALGLRLRVVWITESDVRLHQERGKEKNLFTDKKVKRFHGTRTSQRATELLIPNVSPAFF